MKTQKKAKITFLKHNRIKHSTYLSNLHLISFLSIDHYLNFKFWFIFVSALTRRLRKEKQVDGIIPRMWCVCTYKSRFNIGITVFEIFLIED